MKINKYKEQVKTLTLETLNTTGYLALNKTLVKKLGVIKAVILSNYIEKHLYFTKNHPENKGWFFLTHQQIVDAFNINEKTIIKYKKELIQDGILKIKMKGLPQKQWFKIDVLKLSFLIFDSKTSVKSGGAIPPKNNTPIPPKIGGANKNKVNKNSIITKNSNNRIRVFSKHPLIAVENKIVDTMKEQLKTSYNKKVVDKHSCSKDSKQIFNYWNDTKIGTKHLLETKTANKIFTYLDKILLKKYSCIEIIGALQRYKIDNDTNRKISLLEFLKGNSYKSNSKDPLFNKFVKEDKNKELTEQIKEFYSSKVLGKKKYKFPVEQHLKFSESSKRLAKLIKKKGLSKYIINATSSDYVLLLFKVLKDRYKSLEEIYPGHLCSKTTFDELIPRFINKNYGLKQDLDSIEYEWVEE